MRIEKKFMNLLNHLPQVKKNKIKFLCNFSNKKKIWNFVLKIFLNMKAKKEILPDVLLEKLTMED